MTKHTPGPWVAIHEPGSGSDDSFIDNGGYRIDAPGERVTQLAFVWVLNHRLPGDGKRQDTGPLFGDVRAGYNARLIAAAPDMLRALRRAMGALMLCAQYMPNDSPYRNKCSEAFNDVESAIAKAEGTPPNS